MIREDFPILKRRNRQQPLIYLDNAATTQKPIQVIEAMADYYSGYNANIHRGIYELSERATLLYEGVRKKIQDFIHAQSDKEIIFVRGATEGINLVAHSFVRPQLKSGDEIIVSEMEHHSNIVPWQLLCQETGAVLRVIPVTDIGELDLNEYEKLLNARTKFVAITHASNVLGTINPIKKIISLAHAYQVAVLIDGAQAVAHLSVDVRALDADFYVFSGHKMYAPMGIGVLYAKECYLQNMSAYQSGGDMIKRVSFNALPILADLPAKFEAGTPNVAGVIGLGAAIDYLTDIDLDLLREHENQLLCYAIKKLANMSPVRLIGTAPHKIAVIAFVMEGVHAHDVASILDLKGICIRAGHHCAMPLMERFKVSATARASFSFYNTFAEIDQFLLALDKTRNMFS
ncbi:MAG: cysteine desulfurase [Pseudomonadota bacterium]